MSKTRKPWTQEMRDAKSALMRRLNQDPDFIAKKNAAMKSDYIRLTKLRAMHALNKRKKTDRKLEKRWRDGIAASSKRPARAGAMRLRMHEIHALDRILFHDPDRAAMRSERSRKAAATRRGADIPPELMDLYQSVRRKVGVQEALRIVLTEARR